MEKEKSAAIKNDIELHMYKVHDGIPVLLNTCYLYDEKGCMVHGSIKGTKDYLLETWRYHTNRHSKRFQFHKNQALHDKQGFFVCITLKIRNHEPDITTYRLYTTVCKPLLRGLSGMTLMNMKTSRRNASVPNNNWEKNFYEKGIRMV